MAKKGDTARAIVYDKIKEAFGENFVDIVDKKIYVTANEQGEDIQFAITVTMPKTPVNKVPKENNEINFETSTSTSALKPKVEISDKEKEDIRKLMEELNL